MLTVFEIFAKPSPDFEGSIRGNGDVPEIEQAVNVVQSMAGQHTVATLSSDR
jgi:hypothetical protein